MVLPCSRRTSPRRSRRARLCEWRIWRRWKWPRGEGNFEQSYVTTARLYVDPSISPSGKSAQLAPRRRAWRPIAPPLGCQRSRQRTFQFKQLAFHVEAPAVAAERTVRGDYTMARHDNRHRIPVVGHAYSTEGFRLANGPGDIGVGPGLAVGNVEQRVPALQLKRSAAQ